MHRKRRILPIILLLAIRNGSQMTSENLKADAPSYQTRDFPKVESRVVCLNPDNSDFRQFSQPFPGFRGESIRAVKCRNSGGRAEKIVCRRILAGILFTTEFAPCSVQIAQ